MNEKVLDDLIRRSIKIDYAEYMRGCLKNQIIDWSACVIYGAGKLGKQLYNWIKQNNGDVKFFIDQAAKPFQKIEQCPVYKLEDKIVSETNGGGVTVLVSCYVCRTELNHITESLRKYGFKNIIANYNLQVLFFPYFSKDQPVGNTYLKNKKQILQAYNLLTDARSKEIYYKHLQSHALYCYDDAIICDDLIAYLKLDFELKKGYSSFIDCGAYVGDTFQQLIEYHQVNEYYGFEPAKNILPILNNHITQLIKEKREYVPQIISIFPCATGNTYAFCKFIGSEGTSNRINQDGNEWVQVIKIDDVIKSRNITMLKMDIEGAEIDALYGAKRLIIQQKPDLAISVYHRVSHLWEILLLLYSWVPEYKFHLRTHQPATLDTVLYATVE